MAPLPSMHAAIRPIIRGRGLSRTIKQIIIIIIYHYVHV